MKKVKVNKSHEKRVAKPQRLSYSSGNYTEWNSFEVDTGGKEISFMTTVEDALLVGTIGEQGIVENLHELKIDKNSKDFKVAGGEVWSRRAKSPLFERVALQFINIVGSNFLHLDEINKSVLSSKLIGMALDLSKAEESLIEFYEIETKCINDYSSGNRINSQKNALIFKNPTLILKEIAEKIIIRLIIAYRKLPSALSTITRQEFKPGKEFIKKITSTFLPSSDNKAFEHDSIWIKELYDIRGEIEHESWDILPFEVVQQEEVIEVNRCRIVLETQEEKPVPLCEYLNTTLFKMATLIEDIIALAISKNLHPPVRLVILPENDSPNRNHYRYVLDLVPEEKEKLMQKIQT
jgi:hypothetical protein